VARRFVADYGVVRLSIGEAVRSVLDTQPHTELSRHILAFLHEGLTVPDELAVHALEVALMDVKCKTRGYVVVKHGRPSVQWWFHDGAGGRGHRPPRSWLGLPNLAVLLTRCGQLIFRDISKFDATRFVILMTDTWRVKRCIIIIINTKNCSLSIVLTATDQKPQKSLKR